MRDTMYYMKTKYVLIALSVIIGFALCLKYSLDQVSQDDLWWGLLMLTVNPAALYVVCGSLEDR